MDPVPDDHDVVRAGGGSSLNTQEPIYEAKGNGEKPAGHHRTFIALWKNAEAELQPRVAAPRERLRKLSPVERLTRWADNDALYKTNLPLPSIRGAH